MSFRYFLPALTFLLILSNNFLSAQSNEVLFTNSKKIDKDRYEDIKGSPYLLEEWQPGTIISQEAEKIEVAAINYNAYTNNFEIKQEGRFIVLDPTWYDEIILNPGSSTPMTYQKVSHPAFKGQFLQILHSGEGQLLKQKEAKISKKTFNNVGKTIHVEQFVGKTTYHWIKDGVIQSFKLSKKSIIKSLGQKKKIEGFLKKNKLKLNSDEHLILLISHLDSTYR